MYNDYDSRREGEIIAKQINNAPWRAFIIPEQVEAWHEQENQQVESRESEESRITEFSCH